MRLFVTKSLFVWLQVYIVQNPSEISISLPKMANKCKHLSMTVPTNFVGRDKIDQVDNKMFPVFLHKTEREKLH